jgi:DNA-binding transcriptional LysR family regulator
LGYYLSSLNLNMLLVFDAVCRHHNMTRAAEDLNLSQPAVSRYMKELRAITGQELFIKTPSGLELTREGRQCWGRAVDILDGCEYFTQYDESDFDPCAEERRFDIAITPINASYYVEQIMLYARRHYPNLAMNMMRVNAHQAVDLLEAREIAACIGHKADPLPPYIECETLREISYTLICSKHNRFYTQGYMDADDFINAAHLKIHTGLKTTNLDRELMKGGILQRHLTEVPDIASALIMLRNTDMTLMAMSENANTLCQQYDDLRIVEVRGALLPVTESSLMWNKCNNAYKPHVWLRSYIKNRLCGA